MKSLLFATGSSEFEQSILLKGPFQEYFSLTHPKQMRSISKTGTPDIIVITEIFETDDLNRLVIAAKKRFPTSKIVYISLEETILISPVVERNCVDKVLRGCFVIDDLRNV